MTKEYNDELNKSFISFILKSVAVILATLGILCLNGIITVNTNESTHVKEVYIDGELCERNTWDELENITAGVDLHINIEDSTTLWSK